jgi:hypothetical protein
MRSKAVCETAFQDAAAFAKLPPPCRVLIPRFEVTDSETEGFCQRGWVSVTNQ